MLSLIIITPSISVEAEANSWVDRELENIVELDTDKIDSAESNRHRFIASVSGEDQNSRNSESDEDNKLLDKEQNSTNSDFNKNNELDEEQGSSNFESDENNELNEEQDSNNVEYDEGNELDEEKNSNNSDADVDNGEDGKQDSTDPGSEESVNKLSTSPYQNGDKGSHVVKLKEDLTILGFKFPENPSSNYDETTEGKVKEFQRYYGLKETGVADDVTLKKMEDILSLPYQDGDRSEHIIKLKEDLTLLGFGNFPKNPSNAYGKVTTGVVKDFQSYYGLTADGSAGPATMDQIEKVLSSSDQDGERGDHIVKLKKDLTLIGFGNLPKSHSTGFGSVTEGVVREFQSYYDLVENGIADDVTLKKMEDILSLPYQDGDRSEHIIKLKKDLTLLGFGNFPKNPSNAYGKVTTGVVKDFQSYYGLTADGSAGPATMDQIEKVLSSSYQDGERGDHIVKLKKDLTLLGFGNFPKSPSTGFGSVTEGVVREFQSYYDLVENGIADDVTLKKMEDILSLPYQDGDRSEHIIKLKKDLTLLGFGNFPKNPSNAYGKVTTGVVKDFQSYYGLTADGSAGPATMDQIEKVLSSSYQDGERKSTRLNSSHVAIRYAV